MCASCTTIFTVWNSQQQDESCGSPAQAQASARVDVPTAHLFHCSADQGIQHVCTHFLHENAWNCARQTSDRGLESQRHEKASARICARPPADHDLASVISDKKETKEKETEAQNEKCKYVTVVFFCGTCDHVRWDGICRHYDPIAFESFDVLVLPYSFLFMLVDLFLILVVSTFVDSL